MRDHPKDRSQENSECCKSNERQSRVNKHLTPKIIRIENQIYNIENVVETMKKKQDRLRNIQNDELPITECTTTTPQTPEGDELYKFVGDGDNKKQRNTLRLYYNNCNGLAATKLVKAKMAQGTLKKDRKFLGRTVGNTKVERMLATLKKWNTDIICLSETNVAWDKPVAKQIYNLVKAPFAKEACWVTSASTAEIPSLVKPGGTAMLVDVTYTGSIIDRGQDWTTMGRWSYITLKGRNDRVINIITGYRCNNISTPSGATTAWAQQYSIARQRGIQQPRPHADFLIDLEKWLSPKITNGEEVLLALDANEEWSHAAKIKTFASKLGLLNIAKTTHDDLPPSRPQSNKTIDFILGTETILDSVKYLSMTPYDLENLGDHRGILIDLDSKTLFGCDTNQKVIMPQRKLKTNDVTACEKYLEKLEDKFVYHNVFKRTSTLARAMREKGNTTSYMIKQYEALHTDIYRSCRYAEAKCKKSGNSDYYWSPKLEQAIETQRYWRLRHSRAQTLSPPTFQMKTYQKKHGIQDEFVDLNSIKDKLKEATDELHQVQEKSMEYRADFLQRLAQKYSDENNIPVEKAIKAILSHEEDREV